jgi:hypothetical protein
MTDNCTTKVPKKRGRKPKGGKIISVTEKNVSTQVSTPNIILHLKCNSNHIEDLNLEKNISINSSYSNFIENDNFNVIKKNNNNNFTNPDLLNENSNLILQSNNDNDKTSNNNVILNNTNNNINKKLKILARDLHTNDISDKKSACFWCTCDFDNPPIFIPKYVIDKSYHVYGCFCSPECATGYLFNQSNIDLSAKYERYALLNHIYCKIYNYEKNIKPAPDPFYTLDKFYGSLSIQEYRQLLKNERLLLIVDKPLTRSLPELHEDNDNFIFNVRSGESSFKLKRNSEKKTKSEIFENNFNMR